MDAHLAVRLIREEGEPSIWLLACIILWQRDKKINSCGRPSEWFNYYCNKLTLGINRSFSNIVFSLRFSSNCCWYLSSSVGFGSFLGLDLSLRTWKGRRRIAEANLQTKELAQSFLTLSGPLVVILQVGIESDTPFFRDAFYCRDINDEKGPP